MKLVHWPLIGGFYIRWYSEERTGRGCSPQPPRILLAVSNVTVHPSMVSVPITVLLFNGPLLCGFNVPIKGLRDACHCDSRTHALPVRIVRSMPWRRRPSSSPTDRPRTSSWSVSPAEHSNTIAGWHTRLNSTNLCTSLAQCLPSHKRDCRLGHAQKV